MSIQKIISHGRIFAISIKAVAGTWIYGLGDARPLPGGRLAHNEGVGRHSQPLNAPHSIFDGPDVGLEGFVHLLEHEGVGEILVVVTQISGVGACGDRNGHWGLVDGDVFGVRGSVVSGVVARIVGGVATVVGGPVGGGSFVGGWGRFEAGLVRNRSVVIRRGEGGGVMGQLK